MATIRPNAEPAATTVAAGDIFLIDGATGLRALAATQVGVLDANLNLPVNNVIEGFASTATAAGTTVLTAASASQQFFTGSTTQTVTLPVVSTYAKAGAGFFFQNSSTGALTIQSSGGNTVKIIGPGAFAIVTCISLTGTTAASWQATYFADIVVSGKVLTLNNSLTLAGTDGTTMTFPTTSASVARTDAANTFTGTQTVGALVATTINGNTFTAGTGVLTLAAAKTLTANNSLTLAGTDGKTLTVSNSLTLAGTDGTTQTFPSTSGTVVTSVSSNVVTNAMRAQMAAFTLKGNNTSGVANEADIDVTALTLKASPISGDIVLIQDSAASNAFKRTTVGALASAGSVASIAGNTGAFTLTGGITNSTNAIKLALNNATFQSNTTGLNPTGTVSLTDVMMGMGATCTLTPVYSTRVKVTFTGTLNSTGGFATFAGFRFGTGVAPSNAAAVTGTQVAATMSIAGAGTSSQSAPFTISVIITGLTAGTAYWFDLAMHTGNASNTASVTNISCNAEEF
jgi:hypothetical protein